MRQRGPLRLVGGERAYPLTPETMVTALGGHFCHAKYTIRGPRRCTLRDTLLSLRAPPCLRPQTFFFMCEFTPRTLSMLRRGLSNHFLAGTWSALGIRSTSNLPAEGGLRGVPSYSTPSCPTHVPANAGAHSPGGCFRGLQTYMGWYNMGSSPLAIL